MKQIYIVQANGKVSQEAYLTLDEAKAFITSRTKIHFTKESDNLNIQDPFTGILYEIHIVTIKEIN